MPCSRARKPRCSAVRSGGWTFSRRPNTEITPQKLQRIGAADRRLIHTRAPAKKGRVKIIGDVDLVIGRSGQFAGPNPEPLGRRSSAFRPPRESASPATVFGSRLPSRTLEQFDEGLLALPAYQPVDIGRVQHRRWIEAAEIAAPDDRDIRIARLERFRQRNRAHKLRSRHHRERDQRGPGRRPARAAPSRRSSPSTSRSGRLPSTISQLIVLGEARRRSPSAQSGKRRFFGRVARGLTKRITAGVPSQKSNRDGARGGGAMRPNGRNSYQSG